MNIVELFDDDQYTAPCIRECNNYSYGDQRKSKKMRQKSDTKLESADCSVLFLDVDGVLNRCGKFPVNLESELLANLVRIVENTDCRIVLSSTWRLMDRAMGDLKFAFDDLGLILDGVTPDLARTMENGIWAGKERGHEIQAWMDDHFTPDRFCILDDNSDMAHLLPKLIKTNSFEGLTDAITDRVIDALNDGSNPLTY